MNLKILKEYWDLCEPLTKNEYEELKNDIKENGYKKGYPIIINEDRIVLDGHHRFKICDELNIEPSKEVQTFPDKLSEKLFVADCNLKRKNLNKFRRIRSALKTEPILKEIAKKNSLANLKQGDKVPDDQNSDSRGSVNKQLAKRAGASHDTIWKVRTILKKEKEGIIPDEIIDKLIDEKVHIDRVFQTYCVAPEKHKNIPQLPDGEFDVILADPPWKYDVSLRGSAANQYETMENLDISKLEIPSADNAILFLWATQPMIQKALEVMNEWGFEYHTGAVWIKNRIGTGFYFRLRHELLLIGIKGIMPAPEEHSRVDSVIEQPMQKHSEKPDIVYSIIENMYPNRKYLELFARKERNGWTAWGNEIGI